MTEMKGQLPLFSLAGCDTRTRAEFADEVCHDPTCWCTGEVCEECGTVCTSSKECVETSGLYHDDPA